MMGTFWFVGLVALPHITRSPIMSTAYLWCCTLNLNSPVDDDEVILDIGTMMLEKLGHKVLGAKSGAEAVSIYKENKNIIDLVLFDLNMPVEGGEETFKKIREI